MEKSGVLVPILLVLHSVCSLPEYSFKEINSFKEWMMMHNKDYSSEEYTHRMHTFIQNKRKIDAHNNGRHSFHMGLNQFSDMTFSEFKTLYLMKEPQNCSATRGNHYTKEGPLPDFVDWRKKGNFVTPVKNQGACGSCWTFSTTGCLESAIAIKSNKLLSLAEQQLVDCAQNFNNHGCSGGLPSQAFEYIKYNHGLEMEKDYPYKGENGSCKFQPSKAAAFVKDVVNITEDVSGAGKTSIYCPSVELGRRENSKGQQFHSNLFLYLIQGESIRSGTHDPDLVVSEYDENGMVDAVARVNPVSFAFQVTDDFLSYSGGIYSNKNCASTPDKVNHAVLAVGYGVLKGTKYWIVKNSWGPGWGIDGYFYIERGKNMCGLAACASYPIPSSDMMNGPATLESQAETWNL